jgi:hypothetical protein
VPNDGLLKPSYRTEVHCSNAVADEVANYLNYKPSANEADNGLLFWRIHCNEFPNLQIAARHFLSISASSVSVENVFCNGYNFERETLITQPSETKFRFLYL